MRVVVTVARRVLAPVVIALAVAAAACGDITFAPDAGAVPRPAGAPGDGGGPPGPGPVAGAGRGAGTAGPGGTGCASNGDCQSSKLKRCDVARGLCVGCLTSDDCDGDRRCVAGTCGPKG